MVIRTKKNTNFTVIDNRALKDERVSWKAKGLFAYVMSLPDDWQISIEDLAKRSKDGRDATASALRELVKLGYCKRERITVKGKFKNYEYTFYEQGIETELVFPVQIELSTKKSYKPDPKYIKEIFEHYISLDIIQHRTLTDKHRKAIKKSVKDLGQDVVIQALTDYAQIVHGADYFFTHLYPLDDFLNNGISKFLPEAKPFQNFLKYKSKNKMTKPVDLAFEME